MNAKKTLWTDPQTLTLYKGIEAETDLPNGGFLRLYGCVQTEPVGYHPHGGPDELETVVHIFAASFWASTETADATTVGSLEELVALTGLSSWDFGSMLYSEYLDRLENDEVEQYLRYCERA